MGRRQSSEGANAPLATGRSNRSPEAIARDIGVAILAGAHPPGSLLPGEVDASAKVGVARSVYREAVRILAAKGLVESRRKVGTHVSPRERWNVLDPEVLAWSFAAEPSEKFIRDLFELRMAVEPAAAELAARRRTGRHIARMGHALEEMARLGLATPEGQDADQSFHVAILDASDNAPLLALSSSISAAVTWTTIYKQRKRRLPRDPLPDHRLLYDAIVDGDGERARAAMTDLIRLALEDTERS